MKKIKILQAKNKQYYFVITGFNNRILATSEMYKTKQSCMKTAALMQWHDSFNDAVIEDCAIKKSVHK